MENEYIVAPAIMKDNKIRISRFSHAEMIGCDCFFKGAEQGFITNLGRFVDRKEALKIAEKNNKGLNKFYKSDELYSEDLFKTEFKLVKENKELRERVKELEEERQIVGMPVRNKRDGRIGIVLHQWKSGSVAVLESITPRVINTHDNWNTLEIVTDEVKQTQTKCETIPVSLVEEKIEELDIEISACEYADDDSEEYKQDIEKNKAGLLMAKKVLQQLLESEEEK